MVHINTHNNVHAVSINNTPPSIYFGGCAFGGAFYVGVYYAIIKEWGEEFLDQALIGGDSVGAVFAIGLGLKLSPEYMEDVYRRTASFALKSGPHRACIIVEELVREMLCDPNAYKILQGRIFIGTTAFFSRHRWHLSWHCNEDLIDCIKGSYHIPFYCFRTKSVKNIEVLDGAYSFAGMDLPHGDDTLFIGIDPHAEITRTFTNSEMFFPPENDVFEGMKQSGEDAFHLWVKQGKHMIAKVGNRHPNYQALYVLWFLKMVDIISVWLYDWLLIGLIVLVFYSIVYYFYHGTLPFILHSEIMTNKLKMLKVYLLNYTYEKILPFISRTCSVKL